MGKAALSELSLNATEWKNAYWAKEKGLYVEVFDNIKELDKEVDLLSNKLASYNPKALTEMKKVLWEGTEHWDKLLIERAEISGELVLSEYSKNALKQFKK
jgi:methylglutaconyl-CoA hydratase